jgi:hypothetical protein
MAKALKGENKDGGSHSRSAGGDYRRVHVNAAFAKESGELINGPKSAVWSQ